MDVFQSIGQGIEKTLDALKDSKERIHYQAKKYSRQSKLRLEKSRVEGEIKRLYEDLGEAYYQSIEEGSDQAQRFLHELVAKLDQEKEILKALDNQLKQDLVEEAQEPKERTCPHCHEVLEEGDQFCSHCGSSMEETKVFKRGIFVDNVEILTKMCPNCGKQVSVHAKYCNRCGLDLENL